MSAIEEAARRLFAKPHDSARRFRVEFFIALVLKNNQVAARRALSWKK
jgi:hypothetical protein